MPSVITLAQIGEVGRQAQALGNEASRAINSALLSGAKIAKEEASRRIPRYKRHRSDHGRSSRHLADNLKAEVVTKQRVAGVTVEGGIQRGPSYYVKFVEYGTTKMAAREYIQTAAVLKHKEMVEAVDSTLKEKLGL